MKKTGVIILIILAAALFTPPANGHHDSIVICGANGGKVIDDFVDREFPPVPSGYYDRMPLAINDIKCEDKENMFNLAVLVIKISETPQAQEGQRYFGIFHIHFSSQGEFISSSAITPWEILPLKNEDAGKLITDEWCDFIKNQYPQEQKEYGCK